MNTLCVNRWIYKSKIEIILETEVINLRLWKPERQGTASILHFTDKNVKSKKQGFASTHT